MGLAYSAAQPRLAIQCFSIDDKSTKKLRMRAPGKAFVQRPVSLPRFALFDKGDGDRNTGLAEHTIVGSKARMLMGEGSFYPSFARVGRSNRRAKRPTPSHCVVDNVTKPRNLAADGSSRADMQAG